MKTLKVGQDVYLTNGICGSKGKVVRVTSWGVEVQEYRVIAVKPLEWKLGDTLLRFDFNGKPCDSEGKPYYTGEPTYEKMYYVDGIPDPRYWEELGIGTMLPVNHYLCRAKGDSIAINRRYRRCLPWRG